MADNIIDIYRADSFSMVSMTAAINRMPFAPGRAGRIRMSSDPNSPLLFAEEGVATTSVSIEETNGLLSLIPTTPRGGPGNENKRNRNRMRNLNIPHLDLNDSIFPEEIQNLRVFGQPDNALAGPEAEKNRRLAEMAAKHDATVEYGRIGAIKGVILDADGTTQIYNLFTEFGVSQTSIDFTLGTTTADMGAKLALVKNAIESELGAMTYDHVHCFMGATFFANFIAHPSVVKAYERWMDGQFLRTDYRYDGFDYKGVTIEQYRGTVGGVDFIAANEAYFFPVGVPGLFRTFYAPADYMETVNTIGIPRYAKAALDPLMQRFIRMNTQSNPLSINTRPATSIKGTTSN